ncbi:hypothetical protein GS429_12130 [Natronorubrum sp. JWXQ-INN-674]|uniref:Uncharacterized protein n=1 Tax=Natronorubrum halalkaliphilum TaxID=2691917 RepID=A0A6B0VMJ2_9EURY|nr:hypothetical protein [Natronorubrum halalkaliphilum]MXV62800.1 hypothetical protein [Natronorubrum halalkaliphilum]
MDFDEPKLEESKPSRRLKIYKDRIETTEQQEAFERALNITKQVEQTAAYRIADLFSHLSRSTDIVDLNYESLIDVFDRARDLSDYTWEELGELNIEFLTTFSNYVISVKSRENHTRDIILPEIEEYHVLSSIEEEYEKKIAELGLDIHGYFFTSLRNYFVHEGIPETMMVLGDDDEPDSFSIPKEIIIESSTFSTRAKGYVNSWEETVDLEEAVKAYHEAADELYSWFFEYTEALYKDEYRVAELLDEEARLYQEIFFNRCEVSFTKIQWAGG